MSAWQFMARADLSGLQMLFTKVLRIVLDDRYVDFRINPFGSSMYGANVPNASDFDLQVLINDTNLSIERDDRSALQEKLVSQTCSVLKMLQGAGLALDPVSLSHAPRWSKETIAIYYMGRSVDLRFDFGTDPSTHYGCASTYLVLRVGHCLDPKLQ